MDDLIKRQDAIETLEKKKDKTAKGDIARFYNTIIQHDIDALMEMPSANQDLSGYSDRLWESAYASGYERCKQDAIDEVAKFLSAREGGNATWWKPVAESVIDDLQSAQPRIMTCSKCKHKTKCFSQIAATNKYQTTTIFYDIDFCSRWENEDNG